MEYPIHLQIQRLTLSDSLASIGLLYQDNEDIFTMIDKHVRPSTYTEDDINSISGSVVFKLDLDRLVIQRIVYNLLDYLGDIGGLFGTFTGLATTFSLILNYNGVYHLLTSSLFQVETRIAGAANDLSTFSKSKGGLGSIFASKIAG